MPTTSAALNPQKSAVKKKPVKDNAENAFGFTTISEAEVTEQVKEQATKEVFNANRQLDEAFERADFMYETILPLLENLMRNPENELIKWPNRKKTLMAFKDRLDDIRLGKITK